MSLKKRLFDQLIQTGRRVLPQPRFAPASLIDTVTNPASYAGLADEATQALGQLLPRQFRGAGFQNVPTSALGALDDLRNIPAGATKDLAQRQATKEFSKAAGSGTVRVPVIPTGGQPVVPGTVQMLPDSLKQPGLLNRLRPKGPLDALGRGFQIFEGANVINDLRKGNYSGAAMNAALMFPGRTLGLAKSALMNPIGGTAAGLLALELGAPASVADGTMDTPEAQKANELYDRLRKDDRPEQGAGLDMDAIRQMSEAAAATEVQLPAPSAPPNTPPVIPQTNFPSVPNPAARPYAPSDNSGNIGATYGNGTSTMPHANVANTVLPPNAEQILQADPMQIYQQARNAAVGQDQAAMNKVRDLGLAIHRQQFPQFYKTENAMPGAMTAKDEAEALTEIEPSQIDQAMLGIYSGNQPVLDPNKFLQVQLSGRVAR